MAKQRLKDKYKNRRKRTGFVTNVHIHKDDYYWECLGCGKKGTLSGNRFDDSVPAEKKKYSIQYAYMHDGMCGPVIVGCPQEGVIGPLYTFKILKP